MRTRVYIPAPPVIDVARVEDSSYDNIFNSLKDRDIKDMFKAIPMGVLIGKLSDAAEEDYSSFIFYPDGDIGIK